MIPLLDRDHRVIAVDLLGHGGSEKPAPATRSQTRRRWSPRRCDRLGVRDAEVVGHSLGGPVAIALAERSPQLVDRLVIIDSTPDNDATADVGLIGQLPFKPVIGEALWRIKPDFAIKDGLEVAFAPGFDVPDAFVDDVKRMTYSSYDDSPRRLRRLHRRRAARPARMPQTGKPLLAIMGAEEQIVDDSREGPGRLRHGAPAPRPS